MARTALAVRVMFYSPVHIGKGMVYIAESTVLHIYDLAVADPRMRRREIADAAGVNVRTVKEAFRLMRGYGVVRERRYGGCGVSLNSIMDKGYQL